MMTSGHRTAAITAAIFAGALGFGCAATLQNYDKVSLGMTAEQVMEITGKPNRKFRMESAGQGTLLPTPAGKSETWFYKSGMVQFHDGKVVAKGVKVK